MKWINPILVIHWAELLTFHSHIWGTPILSFNPNSAGLLNVAWLKGGIICPSVVTLCPLAPIGLKPTHNPWRLLRPILVGLKLNLLRQINNKFYFLKLTRSQAGALLLRTNKGSHISFNEGLFGQGRCEQFALLTHLMLAYFQAATFQGLQWTS